MSLWKVVASGIVGGLVAMAPLLAAVNGSLSGLSVVMIWGLLLSLLVIVVAAAVAFTR